MFELFTTREIAVGIYLALIIVYLVISKKMRPYVKGVVKSALQGPIIRIFLIIIGYGALITYLLTLLPFWKWTYLKDIIMWIVIVGIPLSFNSVSIKEEKAFVRIITNNFLISALIEFVCETFTFSLLIELLLQPFLFIMTLLQLYTEKKEEYKQVCKFVKSVLSIIALIIGILTIREIIIQIGNFNKIDLLMSFLIPVFYSIVYVPLTYIICVYSKYENFFILYWFNNRNNEKIIARKRRIQVIKTCRMSLKRIEQFEKICRRKLTVSTTQDEFANIIQEFKNR